MDDDDSGGISETTSENASAAATDMQVEEEVQAGRSHAGNDEDLSSAIEAVSAAHADSRARLESIVEEVNSMFEVVNDLMADARDLLRQAGGTSMRSENADALSQAAPSDEDEMPQALERADQANEDQLDDDQIDEDQPDDDLIDENQPDPEQDQVYVDLQQIDDEIAASLSPVHSDSDMSLDSPGSEDDSDIEAVPRWMIPSNRVRSAVEVLVSHARSRDGGIAALLNRDNFLQRVRSMVFTQDRHRSRHSDESSLDTNPDGGVIGPPPPLDIDMEEGVRFDTNLPAEHSYFGPNVNRVPGVDYLEVGSTHRMLIFMHQHILFPGEVLPFLIDGSIIDDEVQESGRDGVIFGVGFPLMQPPEDNQHKLYGVTCQIYEKGQSGTHFVFYKSRALQRIVINCDDINGPPQYIARNPTMKCYSKVKILPEYFLPEPLKCIDMGSLNRFRDIPSMQDKFRRYQITTTPWPIEACQEYSFEDIIEKARKKLEIHKIDTMPKCPIQLSYWLVRNLHLTEKVMRLTFLTDSVNTRLQLIGTTLKEESIFYCRYCNSSLAFCSDLFAMSKHGVQTQYCNSAGYIHETNTVYRVIAQAIEYNGEPSTEFSWFPGYQWHIILCKFCAQHVGWEFKAIESNLVPKIFFGLAGSSVRIGKISERTPVNGSTFVVRNLLRLVSGGEAE